VEHAETAVEGSAISALSDADLFGLRLAGQVLGHKAALAGRPLVARWFADFEAVVAGELAQRGVGIVLTDQPGLELPSDADAADRRLLGEYLELLAGNEGLSDAQRMLCRSLIAGIAE
jgi:hypothetical protein